MDPTTVDDQHELIKEIGRGNYGIVYKAMRSDGKIIALKVIDIPTMSQAVEEKLIQNTNKEIDYLKLLSNPMCNPFVICYYNSYYDLSQRQFLIEMEYIEGEDMRSFVEDLKENNPDEVVNYYLLLIAKDLASGLDYIHSKSIIHSDIKLENVMIDETSTPRFIDFGLSCNLFPDKNCNSIVGTPWYMAPELVTLKIRTSATDMWALGVLLYTAATGEFPYTIPKETIQALFYKIENTLPAKLMSNDVQLNNIVNNLLVIDPVDRWKADDILNELKTIPRPEYIPEAVRVSSVQNTTKLLKPEVLLRSSQRIINDLIYLV